MTEEHMKQVKSVAVAVLALAAMIYVYQYGRSIDQTYPSRTFMVDGEAKMETATDIAAFTASVVTEGGKNVAEIQKQNVEKMNTINAFLQEKGVEKKDFTAEPVHADAALYVLQLCFWRDLSAAGDFRLHPDPDAFCQNTQSGHYRRYSLQYRGKGC